MSEKMLQGDRQPVGAVLRVGRKNPQHGAPEHNDRFYIVSPHESAATFKGRASTVRQPMPEFKSFNERSESEGVTVFRGELVHAQRADCWDFRRYAHQLPGDWPAHPNRRPACESRDNATATRLFKIGEDGSEDWREIECMGRQCEFSQEHQSGRGPWRPCKILARLYFAPRWKSDNLPAPLMKLTTRSWSSAENIEGFFNYVEATARELSMERFSFLGCPFILTLTMKTQPTKGRKFPVLSITPDGNLVDVFANQRAAAQLAGGDVPLLLAGTSVEEQAPEVVDADYQDVSVGVPNEQMEIGE